MSDVDARPAAVSSWLGIDTDGLIEPRPDLWGFGGLHGGLTLALLAERMQQAAPARQLRSLAAQYHRPIRRPFEIGTTVVRAGRTLTAVGAEASVEGRASVTASGTWASLDRSLPSALSPAPDAPRPPDCPIFTIPPEFVPFAVHTEIRPVGPNRPFAGCERPELTAWIRLLDDDRPPDLPRLLVLMDSLAPSYAAVLREPVPIPTIEYTVRPAGTGGEPSPWILLHARTRHVSDGWVDELIDAWDLGGTHLAAASQLRLVV